MSGRYVSYWNAFLYLIKFFLFQLSPLGTFERCYGNLNERPHQLNSSGDDEKIQNDNELQNWAKLLNTKVDQGGAGIRVSKLKSSDALTGLNLMYTPNASLEKKSTLRLSLCLFSRKTMLLQLNGTD